ncbi:MAG: hypothetical protein MJ097_07115 [Dorea sp.]|nr:hypothetical protein [Dorea sp.]
MKKSLLKTLVLVMLFTMTLGFATVHAEEIEVEPPVTGEETEEPEVEVKEGLQLEDGAYYYYVNGETVKSKWIDLGSKTYFFGSNGKAKTGLATIKGKTYLFNTKGVLKKASSSTAVITLEGKKYLVTTSGTVKKNAWDSTKTYYFGRKFLPVTGKQVINGKFYAFSSNGKKNVDVTKKIQAACKYNKSPIAPLLRMIGNPTKTKYVRGCFGSGKDGYLTFKYFIVFTYKEGAKEVFMGCDPTPASLTYVE